MYIHIYVYTNTHTHTHTHINVAGSQREAGGQGEDGEEAAKRKTNSSGGGRVPGGGGGGGGEGGKTQLSSKGEWEDVQVEKNKSNEDKVHEDGDALGTSQSLAAQRLPSFTASNAAERGRKGVSEGMKLFPIFGKTRAASDAARKQHGGISDGSGCCSDAATPANAATNTATHTTTQTATHTAQSCSAVIASVGANGEGEEERGGGRRGETAGAADVVDFTAGEKQLFAVMQLPM